MHCINLAELTRYLKKLQQSLGKANKYILLCFDEYERIIQPGSELLKLPDSFRYWIQHLENFICLFAGSHRIQEISTINWSDYLINVRTVPISFLDYDSCLQLVTRHRGT